MNRKSNKISTRWIRETRDDFRAFLDETDFPDPERLGERGPVFKYPEWLVMFIAVLSVKLKIKTYTHAQMVFSTMPTKWRHSCQMSSKLTISSWTKLQVLSQISPRPLMGVK
jgi:hypothetical protein